jgi:carbonic anhydrase/acetyltransferase-like protein (isoleucine patch superfamily)
MNMGKIAQDVFLAEGSRVVADVTIGDGASVWYNAVIRGDEEPIRIGRRTNIQDNAVLHAEEGFPMTIGDGVTIGHGAIVHGCTVGSNVLIGMGAIVMSGAVLGDDVIIGAGSLVTGGTVIPPGHMAFGVPARVRRPLTASEIAGNRENADRYIFLARKAREAAR